MRKIKILSITILLIITLGIINTVNGAIAIKEAGNTVLTGKTISEFFDMAKQMTDAGQALEGTSLDPHMATNKEWAAVSYLSNSNYGTAGEGKNTGMTVTINGNSHYSTNDNITGVIDWGKDYSFTAGVLSEADTKITDDTIRENGKSLLENIENNSKVDKFDQISNDYMSATGWYGTARYTYVFKGTNYSYPYSGRKGLFSFEGGNYSGNTAGDWYFVDMAKGYASTRFTFRPVL